MLRERSAQLTQASYIPLQFEEYPEQEMRRRAAEFYAAMRRRRIVRTFADRPVPCQVIEDCLRTAATVPSGANQ
jgi:iodotyrosine deiodinase